tara:strand:+ start:923 stop:1312 length:390 start_codon:yes stop_codon:yes gene_type:complete
MTLWNKVLYLLAASVLAVFFSTSIFSATTHKGTVGEDGTEIEVTRVFYSSPTYPRNAIRLGREGYVLIEFDVDTDGAVLDPYVIESEPTGVFERAAIKAVRKWLYTPPSYNGVSVKVNDVRAKVSFALQ